MKRIFLDLDGTIAKFNVKNALQRFDNEKGFFANLKAYVGIEVINELASTNQLYIISASPNEQADIDKMTWIGRYLPNMPLENITLCRIGEDKAKVIENKYNFTINEEFFLLDDYTKNLIEWQARGGTPIKRITKVADNSRGLWKGLQIKHLKEVAAILA